MSNIHFTNYRLKQGTDYFLYIGELKNYGLNIYLKEALSRIHKPRLNSSPSFPTCSNSTTTTTCW